MTEESEKYHNPEDDFLDPRVTPLYGIRIATEEELEEVASRGFEVNPQVVHELLRRDLKKDLEKNLRLILNEIIGFNFVECAIKSPTKALEYFTQELEGVVPRGVFDRVKETLSTYSMLEQHQFYKS